MRDFTIQSIVNLPTGLQLLYLLRHLMEIADVYSLCSREELWSKRLDGYKDVTWLISMLLLLLGPRLLCNTLLPLAPPGRWQKAPAPKQFLIYAEWQIASVSRIIFWFVFTIKTVKGKMFSKDQWKFPYRQNSSLLLQPEIHYSKLRNLSRPSWDNLQPVCSGVATTEPM